MYAKRFYRENGSERKREHRQRRAAAELLSDLCEFQSDSTDDEDITDSSMNMPPIDGISLQHTAIDDDHFGVACQSDDQSQRNDSNGNEDDGDDEDDDDVHLEELLALFDTNRERKLYSSCTLSIYEACLELIKISRDLNLNKLQMGRLLSGIRLLLPSDSKLPRTVPGLLKVASKECSAFDCISKSSSTSTVSYDFRH